MQGNVVLTDSKYEVLTLLRSHRDDDKGMALMPRHPYPIHTIRLRTPLDADQLAAALAAADAKATVKGKHVPQHQAKAFVDDVLEDPVGRCTAKILTAARGSMPMSFMAF